MVKSNLSLLLLIVLLISCDKDSESNIRYVDIIPDRELQSIVSYEASPEANCDDIGVPEEGELTYDLDMNDDGLIDYTFVMYHYLEDPGDCVTFMACPETVSKIELTSKYSSYKIATHVGEAHIIPHNTSVIDQHVYLANRADIYSKNGCPENATYDFSDGYLIVLMDDRYGYIQIKNSDDNGIVIMDYALALPGEDIITGKK